MIITKKINNNVALSYDNKKNEIVVMGVGIVFNKKVGDLIDEKTYRRYSA